jgi:DNA-binding Lrp family transcriptional regulator
MWTITLAMTSPKIDDKDLAILEILETNSRASIREIGKQIDMRPSTVHQRLKRLTQEGIIEKFTVKLNDEKLGRNLVVFMLISGAMDKYLDDKAMIDPCIQEIHGITGEYDLLMKLKFKDMKEFNKFIIEFRDKYSDSISKTITMVQTVSLKE